ncbi:MAG: hypothetical protein IJK41_03425 [Muribaculaceae bacterium]|nr:hypothetical protein [Muribaculaceae bacterium]
MRKLLAILVILALIMYFTKPTAEKHKAAIADEIVKAAVAGGLDSTAIVCWDFEGKNAEFVNQAKQNPEEARKTAMEEVAKTLKLKNFWLCNVGTVTLQGKEQNVSLGAFGHVFCTGLK